MMTRKNKQVKKMFKNLRMLTFLYFFSIFVIISYYVFSLIITEQPLIYSLHAKPSQVTMLKVYYTYPHYALILFWFSKPISFIMTCVIAPVLLEFCALIIENPLLKDFSVKNVKLQVVDKVETWANRKLECFVVCLCFFFFFLFLFYYYFFLLYLIFVVNFTLIFRYSFFLRILLAWTTYFIYKMIILRLFSMPEDVAFITNTLQKKQAPFLVLSDFWLHYSCLVLLLLFFLFYCIYIQNEKKKVISQAGATDKEIQGIPYRLVRCWVKNKIKKIDIFAFHKRINNDAINKKQQNQKLYEKKDPTTKI